MQRHEVDPFSLFAGLVFAVIAGGYVLTHSTDVRLHWFVVVPVVLLAMGTAVVAFAIRRIQRQSLPNADAAADR
jgi:hypothetical protein